MKTKELEFAQKDNRNPRVTPHKYLEKYVFTDLHEVFFCDFPHLLYEWILRLKDNHATNQDPTVRVDLSSDRPVTAGE
jgi:hypothetical protein